MHSVCIMSWGKSLMKVSDHKYHNFDWDSVANVNTVEIITIMLVLNARKWQDTFSIQPHSVLDPQTHVKGICIPKVSSKIR